MLSLDDFLLIRGSKLIGASLISTITVPNFFLMLLLYT